MICHKCGAVLPDNSIRCSHCGIRVSMVCPECKTIVPFGERFCSHCGFELLIICPNCNSANVHSAKECRKCHTPLSNIQEKKQKSSDNGQAPFSIGPKFETQYADVKIDNNSDIKLTYKDVDISNPSIDDVIGEFEPAKTHKNEDLDFDNLIENINKKDSNDKAEIPDDVIDIPDSEKETDSENIEYKNDSDTKIKNDEVKNQNNNKKIKTNKSRLNKKPDHNIEKNRTKDKKHRPIEHHQIKEVEEYTQKEESQEPEQIQDYPGSEEFQEYTQYDENQEIEQIQDFPDDEGFQVYTQYDVNQEESEQIQNFPLDDEYQEYTRDDLNKEPEQIQDFPEDDEFPKYAQYEVYQETEQFPNYPQYEENNEYTSNSVNQNNSQMQYFSENEELQEYNHKKQMQYYSSENQNQENTSNITNVETDQTPDISYYGETQENTSNITNVQSENVPDISFYDGSQDYVSDITNLDTESLQDFSSSDMFEEYEQNQANQVNQGTEAVSNFYSDEGFNEDVPDEANQKIEQNKDDSFTIELQDYTPDGEPQETESIQSNSLNESFQKYADILDKQDILQTNDIIDTNEIIDSAQKIENDDIKKKEEKEKSIEQSKVPNSQQAIGALPENKNINDNDNPKPNKRSIIPAKYKKEILNRPAVEAVLTKLKKSIKKHIIAINGPEGCGKSAVIRQVKEILSTERYMTLYGSCSPLSQITSYGFFQDAFLRLLGFPPYRNNNLDAFMREFNRSQFKRAFNFLKPQELSLFLNFLYPTEQDSFENILENKQLMFNIFEKILKAFLTNTNMVIIIDNFDLLDGASYDFINYILSKNFFNNRLKLLVAYQDEKPIQSFFDRVKYDIFENIKLNKFTDEELKDILKMTIGLDVKEMEPDTYLDDVIARADGNAIRLEQDVASLFDINNIYISGNKILIHPENKPEQPLMSVEELIKFRVNFLPAPVKNILFMAAILGYRFATDVICQAATIDVDETLRIIEWLRSELFIVHVDDFTCEFKNLAIWKLIYKEAQNDLLFKENSEKLYEVLKSRVLSSNIQKLISCSEALDKREEFSIWQNTAEITAKLGDTNLFVIAQKQCLKILEEIDMPNADNVRVIIYEQIGKLLSKKSPVEAINYLSNVLDARIKKKNTNKILDVSGYFINSCYLTGNYFGVVEAVDAVVKHLQDLGTDLGAQIALIKTRKLSALLNIGNTEQLINLIKENLLIKINQELTSKQLDISYRNLLMDIWFDANIILAKSYALQGNIEVFATTEYIREVIKNNNVQNKILEAKVTLIEALAHTLIGETSISNEILLEIKNDKNLKIVDKKLLCEWNMINVINRIYENNLNGIKTDLFELAEFSNNINEHATKHLIKLLLGYVFKEEGDVTKAMSIYNEEITYFAKEKMAIGAMLAWALITKASIDTGSFDIALTTATKAYDVSQSPKISNVFFGIYFQKLIAEIYLLRNDLLAVKMYLEKALSMAESNNIKFLLAYINIDYGKYMEENMKSKQLYEKEQVQKTLEYYEKAFNIGRELGNRGIKEQAAKARTAFKTFCQLSGISLS